MRLLRRHPGRLWPVLLVLGLIYGVGMTVYPAIRLQAGSSDFLAFHRTARYFIETGRFTIDYGVYNYLPFFVLLMTPLALLPAWLGCAVFNVLSLGLLGLVLVMIAAWLLPQHRSSALVKVVLPTLMVLPFITACLTLGQVSLLVLFLLMLGWALFEHRRDFAAGLSLSLAALIKAFPVVVLVWFLLKRRWAVLAGAAAGFAIFGAASTAVAFGPEYAWRLHRHYWRRVVVANCPSTVLAASSDRKFRYNNQSLLVVVRRLLRRTNARDVGPPLFVNLADVQPGIALGVYAMLAGAAVLGAAGLARRRLEQLTIDRLRFEFALFVLLGLILSPLVWTRYFSLTLYPLCLLTVRLMQDGDARRANRFALAAWIGWIVAAVLLVSPWCRAVGVHMWATILLAVATGREAIRSTAARSGPSAPPPADT